MIRFFFFFLIFKTIPFRFKASQSASTTTKSHFKLEHPSFAVCLGLLRYLHNLQLSLQPS